MQESQNNALEQSPVSETELNPVSRQHKKVAPSSQSSESPKVKKDSSFEVPGFRCIQKDQYLFIQPTRKTKYLDALKLFLSIFVSSVITITMVCGVDIYFEYLHGDISDPSKFLSVTISAILCIILILSFIIAVFRIVFHSCFTVDLESKCFIRGKKTGHLLKKDRCLAFKYVEGIDFLHSGLIFKQFCIRALVADEPLILYRGSLSQEQASGLQEWLSKYIEKKNANN